MADLSEYEELLNTIRDKVDSDVKELAAAGKGDMSGTEFEGVVRDALIEVGIDEKQISHSTQKFPDFVITDPATGAQIGLEVKKVKDDKWKIPGGSVFESARNDSNQTYVIMGKFGGTPEARLRKYRDCIAGLSVTHSPRFQLDLDLPEGDDFLSKHNAEDILTLPKGDELTKRVRALLRTDKNTWYGDDTDVDLKELVSSWDDLSCEEKNQVFINGVVLFPEVVGSDYSKFAFWLTYEQLIWCKNVRDKFSAGGTSRYDGVIYSAVMSRILSNTDEILQKISSLSAAEMRTYWGKAPRAMKNKVNAWIEAIAQNIKVSKDLVSNNLELTEFEGLSSNEADTLIKEKFIQQLKGKMEAALANMA